VIHGRGRSESEGLALLLSKFECRVPLEGRKLGSFNSFGRGTEAARACALILLRGRSRLLERKRYIFFEQGGECERGINLIVTTKIAIEHFVKQKGRGAGSEKLKKDCRRFSSTVSAKKGGGKRKQKGVETSDHSQG